MRGSVALVLAKAHSWDRLLRRPAPEVGVSSTHAAVHGAHAPRAHESREPHASHEPRRGLRRSPGRGEALVRSRARRCVSWGWG